MHLQMIFYTNDMNLLMVVCSGKTCKQRSKHALNKRMNVKSSRDISSYTVHDKICLDVQIDKEKQMVTTSDILEQRRDTGVHCPSTMQRDCRVSPT